MTVDLFTRLAGREWFLEKADKMVYMVSNKTGIVSIVFFRKRR